MCKGVNNPIVEFNKEKLSTLQKVDFSIELSDAIKNKLETGFNLDLTHVTSIPMRWIKGDTPQHADKGENHFSNTYLMYLTDSIGNLIIDQQTYPIVAGDAHIFSEGLEHSTINTGTSERLVIGPMSETGFHVGAAVYLIYYNNETAAIEHGETAISYSTGYTINTINDISSWIISSNINGTNPTPNGGPYNDGDSLIATGIYYLYPYVAPQQPSRPIYMGSLFTNNAQVYYKPHSLSTGGGGSGVRNSRHKQRKT